MISRKEFSFLSAESGEELYGCIWLSEGFQQYKGIIQIAHGMEEHILRYQGFAIFLAKQGFIVCGHDQVGHGRSVHYWEERGHFGDEESNWKFLLDDMYYVMKFVKKLYEPLPYFLMGHDLGSLFVREFITLYGSDLSGAILLGTSGGNRFADVGMALCKEGICLKGAKAPGYAVHRLMFGAFQVKCEPTRTEYDWLSSCEDAVDQFMEDENCGFIYTYSAYRDIYSLLKRTCSLEWAIRVDRDLPILMLSGMDDPVGDYGKGIDQVYQWLLKAGCHHVTVKLYPGGRHELLNEYCYYRVYRFILKWLYDTIETL